MKKLRYTVLYKDNDLIIIDKPAGMLSIPDRYDTNIDNLLSSLRRTNPQVFTVHRLDKDTSGLIIFAFNAETHKKLSTDFEHRRINKKYLALVSGILDEKEMTLDFRISEDKKKAGKMKITDKGKESKTKLKVIEEFHDVSLLEINLITGRTHQIRVHMQHLGHPMLIDSKYGKVESLFLSQLKGRKYKRKEKEERPLMSRTSLHASQLEFIHPVSSEGLKFESRLPKDFRAVLNQLRKLN